ncbi:MAG: DNA repair protein RecO [Deltaproteobacteria bacterium]|nr:DNA repair protein RecO [Deltaproteobacteria bacterium]
MRRGHYSTEAIVLNSFSYGESDRIVSFYTAEFGRIGAVAKGAFRSKKRFVGNLDACAHVKLDFFYSGSALVRAEAAELVDAFPALRGDLTRLGSASAIVELVYEMTPEWQHNAAYFSIVRDFLSAMSGRTDPALMLLYFEIKHLRALGYLPHLDGCVECAAGFGERQAFFAPEKGGVVCRGCAARVKDVTLLTPGTARHLSMAARMDIEKLERLVPNAMFVNECDKALSAFIRFQIGKELKSRRFLEKLNAAMPLQR